MVFVFDLWTIRHDKSNLSETADNVFSDLCKRMELAERAAAARETEVGGLFGQGGLQLEIGLAFGEGILDFRFGGIDRFSSSGFLIFGQGAQLFQESGEPAIDAEMMDTRLFEGRGV